MAKLYNTKGNKAIMYYIKQQGCTKTEVAKLLNVSNTTLHKYLNNPYNMSLQQLTLLCGLFVCPIEELVYLVTKNKAKIDNKGIWNLSSSLSSAKLKQVSIERQ